VALNAAVAVARHPILVTVDADTTLAADALARLASAFEDPEVAAATGSVLVAQGASLLTRFQQIEYVRNTLIRVAWAKLSALEQLPGALMAVRADWMRAVGGYPTASLTEDYELVYRLYARSFEAGLRLQISAIPTACAYTEAPTSLRPLMRQRTRWFAGFLTTLLRYRRLIGRPRAGVFGLVKLPIKVLDAVHPPLSLLSLLVLGFDTRFVDLRPLAVSLFCLRWAWDSFTLAMAIRFARRAGGEVDLGRAGSLWPWVYVLADGLSYFWLRQVAVLRAYGVALRPSRGWRSPRSRASLPAESPS
jgi:cellulose synthase/poly-beta-1,6-N-acetylglucosamine synthase-like glycosyltransferase